MSVTISNVIRWRYLVAMILRAIGLLFVLFMALTLASWLVEGILDGDLFLFEYYVGRFVFACIHGVIALTLLVGSDLLSRIIVPIPIPRCPKCGYRAHQLTQPICPECGLALPHEWVRSAADHG